MRYFKTIFPSRWVTSPAMARALRAHTSEFDVIHIHSLFMFSTLAAAHYARKHRVPYIVRPHGSLDPFLRRRGRLKKFIYTGLIEKRNLDRATAIHYTSRDERDLAAPVGIKAPSVVVPLGVNLEEFESLPVPGTFRSRYPETREKDLVLFLGRLHFKKGLDLLLQSFRKVAAQLPNVHLVVAGPDDAGVTPKMKAWLANAGILNRATFTGMLTGTMRLAALKDADVWMLPSYTENFGLAVVEAMACRLPVVITDRVNIWREVDEGQAGMVTPCDASALSAAVISLFENPDLRRSLGANAYRLVAEQFTWERSARRMVAVYEDLVGERAPSRSGNEPQGGERSVLTDQEVVG